MHGKNDACPGFALFAETTISCARYVDNGLEYLRWMEGLAEKVSGPICKGHRRPASLGVESDGSSTGPLGGLGLQVRTAPSEDTWSLYSPH